jgi:ubiquinone biosynthesis protein
MQYRPPVSKRIRFLKAYFTTFSVLFSYLSVRLLARFLSEARVDAMLAERHRRNARRVEQTILQLQGIFIKVGQLISIMTNFLPEDFRKGLEGLQDQVPPRPYEDIARRIREELKKDPREIFQEFSETPISSASIGQVHTAVLRTGEKVAVKVQYPDIDEIVRIDLKTLRRIIGIVQAFLPYRGLDVYYREIKQMILKELDFTEEAKNLGRIAANFTDDPTVTFPRVFAEYSTSRVMTTEFIDGVKISDLRGLDAMGVERKPLAKKVVEAYCKMVFSDGLYHADPHPGNLLVRPGPTLCLLDFGAVAEISERMRKGMVAFWEALLRNDTPKIIQAMKDMGFIARTQDPQVFERVVEYFYSKFLEEIRLESMSLSEIKLDPRKGLESIADLRKMDVGLKELSETFHVPKEWIFLERTTLLLLGLCTHLDPEMNPMEIIRPYLEEFVFGKDRDWQRAVLPAARDLGLSIIMLPAEVRRFMTRVQRGEMRFPISGLEGLTRLLYAGVHQMIYAGLGIAAYAFAIAERDRGAAERAEQLTWASYAFLGFLALSMFSQRRKKK